VAESRLRADLNDDRVVLSGKVDLTVGRADGVRAGKVLVDLALIETIRLGVPPRLLASYYLDAGRLQQEAVTEDTLAAAFARVVDGVEATVSLQHEGREPVLRPGAACRWCPRRGDCEEGQRHLAALAAEDGGW
jgi:hypothetical protein